MPIQKFVSLVLVTIEEKMETVDLEMVRNVLMCCKMMSGHVWCWVACELEKSVANQYIGNPPVYLPLSAQVRSG